MQKIKFRAWYGGAMVDVGSIEFFTDGTTHVNEELVGCVIEQFTGFTDAVGLDVYEGDVVRYRRKNAVVVFEDFSWRLRVAGGDLKHGLPPNGSYVVGSTIHLGVATKDAEPPLVLGNIHENQELVA